MIFDRIRRIVDHWRSVYSANRRPVRLHRTASDQGAFREAVAEDDFDRAALCHGRAADELEATFDEAVRTLANTDDEAVT